MIALSPRVVAWLRQRLPAAARARVFALAAPGYVAVEDWPPDRQAQASMAQCVALALLLHVLLVALVGNAPPGSAAPGQGVWGAINITLRGMTPQPGAATVAPAPEATSGPIGTAEERRWGGAVRSPVEPAPPSEAGASKLGSWSPTPTSRPDDPGTPVPRSPAPVLQSVESEPIDSEPAPPPEAPDAGTATLPALAVTDPGAGVRPMLEPLGTVPDPARPLELPAAPDLRPLPPLPRQMPALPPAGVRPVERLTPGRAEALSLPPLAAMPRSPDLRPLPPLAEPRSLPALPAVSPRAADPLVPQRAEPLAAPRLAETPAAPALPALAVAPEPKAMQPLTPRPPDPPAAAPVLGSVPALPAPAVAEVPDLPVLQPVAPVAAAPAPSLPAPPPAPGSAAAQATAAPPAPPGASGPPAVPTMAMPAEVGPGVPRAAAGSPEAGARAGRDVATPASEAASAPRLNLDLTRPRGGEISRQGSRGVLQLMPRPPEIKSKLAEDIEKAARADCRTAHSGAGLLAVGPLVADALRGKGCKW